MAGASGQRKWMRRKSGANGKQNRKKKHEKTSKSNRNQNNLLFNSFVRGMFSNICTPKSSKRMPQIPIHVIAEIRLCAHIWVLRNHIGPFGPYRCPIKSGIKTKSAAEWSGTLEWARITKPNENEWRQHIDPIDGMFVLHSIRAGISISKRIVQFTKSKSWPI